MYKERQIAEYWLMHIRNVRDLAININESILRHWERDNEQNACTNEQKRYKSSSKQEPKDAWHMREAQDSVCMQQPSAGRMETHVPHWSCHFAGIL